MRKKEGKKGGKRNKKGGGGITVKLINSINSSIKNRPA